MSEWFLYYRWKLIVKTTVLPVLMYLSEVPLINFQPSNETVRVYLRVRFRLHNRDLSYITRRRRIRSSFD